MKILEIKDDGVYFKGRKLFFADELDLSGKANIDLSNITVNTDKYEIVYDMDSSDSLENLGYTSGIIGNTTVLVNKTLSKYNYLRVSFNAYVGNNATNTGGRQNVFLINLKKRAYDVCCGGIDVPYFSSFNTVESAAFKVRLYAYIDGTNANKIIALFGLNNEIKNNDGSYFITKIEGVY